MRRTTGIIALLLVVLNMSVPIVHADTATDNAITYLKAKQDTTGQITGGATGDASPWAAIAFSAHGVDITTIKNSTTSLQDYLINNHPTTTAQATEWEKWMLAITASGQNPYDFGGVNYVSTLESTYYNNSQIGDTTSVTDDWFGVLALLSSGVDKADPVLTNSLSFILSHQNTDGGFGYSTTAGSDGNDTAAAIQALVAAKTEGVNTNGVHIDDAIAKAKTYLLSTQDTSGGFLYDTNTWTTAPDADSTTWALMALHVLGMKDATEANNARTWLLTQQASDGGFEACQYNPPDYVCQLASNATTTAHALIGLAGQGWMVRIFDASSITPTPTSSVPQSGNTTPPPTPTPTSTQSSNATTANTSTPTPTPTVNPPAIPTKIPIPSALSAQSSQKTALYDNLVTPSPTSDGSVLAAKTSKVTNTLTKEAHTNVPLSSFLAKMFFVIGILFAGIYGVRMYTLRVKKP